MKTSVDTVRDLRTAAVLSFSLEAIDQLAALQTRIDRKYVVDVATAQRLLDGQPPTARVLEIDGLRCFNYESLYYDTPDWDSYRGAALQRRRRFKIRTRTYLDSGACVLEVKTKGGRGQTIKHRIDHDQLSDDLTTNPARQFIDETTRRSGLATRLQPVLTTTYRRITLVDTATRSRLTLDSDLSCWTSAGDELTLAGQVIVETKSDGKASDTDKWLWAQRIRPARISKFCTTLAALRPDLPSNRWHRTLQRHFLPSTTGERAEDYGSSEQNPCRRFR